MADELKLFANPTTQSGLTVTANVYDGSGVSIGDDIACSEVGSLGIYLGDMPAASAGRYYIRFFDGTSLLSQAEIDWGGTTEIIPGVGEVEPGISEIEATRLILSVLLGKVTGAGTSQMYFRDTADTKDRVYAVVDTDGNRKEVTLDGS